MLRNLFFPYIGALQKENICPLLSGLIQDPRNRSVEFLFSMMLVFQIKNFFMVFN